MVVAPAVLRAREVDPLGVPELVAHEVEVAVLRERARREPRHLVERDAALDDEPVLVHAHPVVDGRVDELEEERLAAHERLVMALHVGDDLLLGALVRERVVEAVHVPVLVAHLLREVEPHVRHAHRHAVVEAHPAVRARRGAPGHAAHVLGDRDRGGLHLVDDAVREREVAPGGVVHRAVEILGIIREGRAEAVVPVEHRGHAVEAVAVEAELVEPVAAV